MADLLQPGIWWLHGTRGSNVFVAEADDGSLALVDTGFGSSAAAIQRELVSISGGRPLAAILLTHRHSDHAGAALAVQRATGAALIAGEGDCEVHEGAWTLTPHLGRSHHFRRARRGPATPATVATAIGDETEVLPGIFAVPVPGHTPGSLCFVHPAKGAAFVGDLVISHGGELTRPLRAANWDDARYLATLSEFAARAPAAGFPGHGQPVLEGFGEDLRTLASYPRRRGGPLQYLARMKRLARFSHGLGRRR